MVNDRCECGFYVPGGLMVPEKRAVHEDYHRSWASGIVLPEGAFAEQHDGVYVVTRDSKPEGIDVAHQLGLRMNVEIGRGGYSLYPHSSDSPSHQAWQDNPRAYVAVQGRRAVGLIIVRERDISRHRWSTWDGRSPDRPAARGGVVRPHHGEADQDTGAAACRA